MKLLKHLPLVQWPAADRAALASAYQDGDIFDDTRGPGAHLADGTRRMIQIAYRRWLGFLHKFDSKALLIHPPKRITPERVRSFVECLALEMMPTSLAIVVDNLLYAARLFDPDGNWAWLRLLRRRLHAQGRPQDRFACLVPGWHTLELGIQLMDEAHRLPATGHRAREIRYRDGLLLTVLSIWPVRRRSVAALTVSRHVKFIDGGLCFLLHPADTKSKRSEICSVPDQLVPYLQRYLKEVRPRLLRDQDHDGFWASYRGKRLIEGRLYDIVRRETGNAYGKAMGLHDFRRAGATFLAMAAPDQVGLTPRILQQASPEVGEKHYNLARSVEASRRFGTHVAQRRRELRPLIAREEGAV